MTEAPSESAVSPSPGSLSRSSSLSVVSVAPAKTGPSSSAVLVVGLATVSVEDASSGTSLEDSGGGVGAEGPGVGPASTERLKNNPD